MTDPLNRFADWIAFPSFAESAEARKRRKRRKGRKKRNRRTATPPPPPAGALRRRPSIFAMSGPDVQRLTRGFDVLKRNGTYDSFVRRHFDAMGVAHRHSFFLPWHRKFVEELEAELLAVDPAIGALPYWPWEQNSGLGSLWTEGSFGPDGDPAQGDRVLTGPFRHWRALIFNSGAGRLESRPSAGLVRRLGRGSAHSLPAARDVESLWTQGTYDVSPWDASVNSFRNRCEGWAGPGLHNRVHVWIGGDMAVGTSPNDPVFFLHHANIDRIWWQWQQRRGIANYQGPGGPDEPMDHLTGRTRPADVLNIHDRGYTYV